MSAEAKRAVGKVDHFKLLCDFGELNWIFTDMQDIDDFLHKICAMVSKHMQAGACTIFLYDEKSDELVLRAAEGFSQGSIGHIRLKRGEGLTGHSLEELRPVCRQQANRDPKFKYVADLDEEHYEAYLAVPIVRGIAPIGVLTVHREQEKPFSDTDIQALSAVASQLANILESTRLLKQPLEDTAPAAARLPPATPETQTIRGMSGSEGIALGETLIFDRERSFGLLAETDFGESYSLEDFENALEETESQLKKHQSEIGKKLDDAASLIFSSHLLMLKDQVLIDEVVERIRKGENPPRALLEVAKRYTDIFSRSANPYVREKVKDVEDLVLRIIGNLDRSSRELVHMKDKVVVARELYPSEILMLSSEGVAGIVQVSGGVTSHVSILARSLGVPMVIVDMPGLMKLSSEARLLVDADKGDIHVNPEADTVRKYGIGRRHSRHIDLKKSVVGPESRTKDGVRVRLLANINLYGDLKQALKLDVEGVGLYRTEFPFLVRTDFPTEEEQYVIYRRVIRALKGREITIRTLDIGGDKVNAYYESYHESNPFLGMRSVRFSLKNREIFRKQLRAILRACSDTRARIMFPMISSLDEFRECREILLECRQELAREGWKPEQEPAAGVLVEVPSLVEIMDDMAQDADFFSLGTNDFVQYMLCVDRTNEKVADYYLPHHPAVLRSLKRVADIALRHGKEISVCGEMAHQKQYIPFLLGIGIRTLSMNAVYLPAVQSFIGSLTMKRAKTKTAALLASSSIAELDRLIAEPG